MKAIWIFFYCVPVWGPQVTLGYDATSYRIVHCMVRRVACATGTHAEWRLRASWIRWLLATCRSCSRRHWCGRPRSTAVCPLRSYSTASSSSSSSLNDNGLSTHSLDSTSAWRRSIDNCARCTTDGHGLGPSMGWVGLNEKYCGIVAKYWKTHTFHCP